MNAQNIMVALDFENASQIGSQGTGSQLARLSVFKQRVKIFYGLAPNNPESDEPQVGLDDGLSPEDGLRVSLDSPVAGDTDSLVSVDSHVSVNSHVSKLGDDYKILLFDMATGMNLRHGSVICAHIFQYRWQGKLSTLSSFQNINHVRNGLLLYKPVEDAFDRARLCIEVNGQSMRFRLLDETLRTTKLYDRAIVLRKAAKIKVPPTQVEMELTTTFGDLDGREVCFPEGCSNRPSKRLLALHARAALLYAKARYPVPETSVLYLDREMSVSDDSHTEQALRYLPV